MTRSSQKAKPEDIVVFSIVRDSECSECGDEMLKGRFLRMEKEKPLCLSCADLDHLWYLPRGDAALTRRATKHSSLRAVVVRFSRARKRYERQGILVEGKAIERAEAECLADADARARARERADGRRQVAEQKYVTDFATRISELYPSAPEQERMAIAIHACQVGSGRIGRTESAKELDEKAVHLAVRAHVRHEHTTYDELLGRSIERSEARAEVGSGVEEVLSRWRGD